jgi:hypothetical protein
MQRVAWNNVAEKLGRLWYFVYIICDFAVECGMGGPMMHTGYFPLEHCERVDKIAMGDTNISTQHRRVIANAICKAIDIAYRQVFKRRMEGRIRLAHLSMEKYPNN